MVSCSFDFPPTNGTLFGYDWMTDNSCFPGGSATPASTDVITTADPKLDPPANNGGPTFTELPASTKLLIDRIPLGVCQETPSGLIRVSPLDSARTATSTAQFQVLA
jgi:hypothetical protein